jgi:hypothetical protein
MRLNFLCATVLFANSPTMNIQPQIKNYVAMFDGKEKKWNDHALAVVLSFIDADKFSVNTPQGPIGFSQWLEAVKVEYENGTHVELLDMKSHPAGIEYALSIKNPDVDGGEEMRVRSVGIMQDDKFIRVEPVDGREHYNKFLGDPTDSN